MLSYMLPVTEKPPLPPANLAGGAARLQLALDAAADAAGSPAMPNGGPARPALARPGAPVAAAHAPPAPPAHAASLPTDSSVSSLSSSDVGTTPSSQSTATPTDARPRNKLQANGKHPTLKRVSFGSSKGSMVETLVYESPLREEPEAVSPGAEAAAAAAALLGPGADPEALAESKRVRVSFFECQRPVQLPPAEVDAASPLVPDSALAIAMATAAASSPDAPIGVNYQRQASTDSGWDNPFRPDGNLSKEADEIVELIKGGKPITPTSGAAPAAAADAQDVADSVSPVNASPQHVAAPGSPAAVAHTVTQQSHAKVGANGNAASAAPGGGGGGTGVVGDGVKAPATPGNVEVQRGTVDPSQAVEHVVLKKKQKCKCCVIQ